MKETIKRPQELPEGVHTFGDAEGVYWTDAHFDGSENNGRRHEIAEAIGVELTDIVSFSPLNHTNKVVVVDSSEGIRVLDDFTVGSGESAKRILAGWMEATPAEDDDSAKDKKKVPPTENERGSYDGVVLVGEQFRGKYILVTGADCTAVGVRGKLKSGEPFVAGVHAGRAGTMTGVIDCLGSCLGFLGTDIESVEVFIGPAAQKIEVPLSLLLEEGGRLSDYSWQKEMVSNEHLDGDVIKVDYNNQGDTTRRISERFGISVSQIHIAQIDTLSNETVHSFRRDKTSKRNTLLISM